MRGGNLSKGGRSIICMRSTSPRSGKSNIVPTFGPKASVIMNRGDANYIITEYRHCVPGRQVHPGAGHGVNRDLASGSP